MSKSMRMRGIAFGLYLVALPLQAQVIRGRVVLSDGATPAVGVVITAISASGAEAARALSTNAGAFALRVPTPGQYSLRALRIGFRPTTMDGVDVAAGATTERTLVLTELPVAIAAMVVRDRGRCDKRARDTETVLALWGQARAALVAAQLTEQGTALDLHVVRVNGHMDAITYGTAIGRGTLGQPFVETDTLSADEVVVSRAFATTPADTLLKAGYLRRDASGQFVFDAPNAEVLLSDAFAARHCFSIANDINDHRDWIGIDFEPQGDVENVIDIRGTLWLDRTSAELRRVDFDYTNVPNESLRLCGRTAGGAASTFSCGDFSNERNRLGLGGKVSLLRLPSGEWIAGDWIMRLPPDGVLWRKRLKFRTVNRQHEICYYGADCRDLYEGWPRLVTTTGAVTRVLRDGVELYRNDSVLTLATAAAAKRAGKRPAHLTGVITRADGTPLQHAVVQAGEPSRATFTDATGAFQLHTLPAGPTTVSVRCRAYQPASFPITLLPDSTRRVTLALASVSAEPAAVRACSSPPR